MRKPRLGRGSGRFGNLKYEKDNTESVKQKTAKIPYLWSPYPSLLSSIGLAVLLGGGEVSMGSCVGLSPIEEACPGLESELSWGVSWLDMDEPEGRMGTLLNKAGEKSLQREKGPWSSTLHLVNIIITFIQQQLTLTITISPLH